MIFFRVKIGQLIDVRIPFEILHVNQVSVNQVFMMDDEL